MSSVASIMPEQYSDNNARQITRCAMDGHGMVHYKQGSIKGRRGAFDAAVGESGSQPSPSPPSSS